MRWPGIHLPDVSGLQRTTHTCVYMPDCSVLCTANWAVACLNILLALTMRFQTFGTLLYWIFSTVAVQLVTTQVCSVSLCSYVRMWGNISWDVVYTMAVTPNQNAANLWGTCHPLQHTLFMWPVGPSPLVHRWCNPSTLCCNSMVQRFRGF